MEDELAPVPRTQKRKRLPETHQLRKRPPHRPAIPSPYTNASSPKVVYVSTSMPFMSAMKRVRQLLDLARQRSLGRINLEQKKSDQHLMHVLAQEQERKKLGQEEVITIKGMGKTIEKTLQLALFFQGQSDCKVQIKTTSTRVVDDIVEKDPGGDFMDGEMNVEEGQLPTSQTRWVSVLEVLVSSR